MSLDYNHYKSGGLLNDRYLKVEDISEGAYGIVSLAEDTHNNGKLVAVKHITKFTEAADIDDDGAKSVEVDRISNDSSYLEEARQEIGVLRKLGSHPNIIELYDSFDSYLILEYCSRGDLYEIIKNGCGPVSMKDIVDLMSQLIRAVTYAHSLGIYHRDIKPENILVTDDWTIKLTDWGLATDQPFCTDFNVGSERYMAPELFDSKNIESYEAAKCDIWSLGICLINIVFGKNPFTVANFSDKLYVHFAANRETIFDIFPTMSYELFGILRHALAIDPDNRDLESMKEEMLKAKHLTIDYDLEAYMTDNEDKALVAATEERSKSNPIISNSPEKRFITPASRKALAIPSYKAPHKLNGQISRNNGSQNYATSHNNNNNSAYGNNNHSYHHHNGFWNKHKMAATANAKAPAGGEYGRHNYFTPKSYLNNYMDRIDKYHRDNKTMNDSHHRNGANRSKYYKKKNLNTRSWRKSHRKPGNHYQQQPEQVSKPNGTVPDNDVFLKPISTKKISPPSSRDMNKMPKRKEGSIQTYSSSTGKYIPPSLRSPHLEPQLDSCEISQPLIEQIDSEDDMIDLGEFDDDDLFMLEEYKSSPRKLERKSKTKSKPASEFSEVFPYPQNNTSVNNHSNNNNNIDRTTLMQPPMNARPIAMMFSTSNGSQPATTAATTASGSKYVPPHHRRNSLSAAMNRNSKTKYARHVLRDANINHRKGNGTLSDFESSSVPHSWTLKPEKINRVNAKFNKVYNKDEGSANVNDMYHTFAALRLDNKSTSVAKTEDSTSSDTNKVSSSDVFISDDYDDLEDDEEDEVDDDSQHHDFVIPQKTSQFKLATRAIPSYMS